ncbi:MAG: T9SS type A sorting domain-containing protein, partial [Candidatus Kapaibacterium sp.]
HISPKYGVALSHNAPSGLSAFPNPIRNHFQIDFTFRSSGETTVRFSDLLGREVYREIFRGAAGEQIKRIQLPKLANGVYQLSIERGPEQLRTKIVVTQ